MPEKLRLDLPVLLPEVPDARDRCVRRLVGALEARPGVENVHVVDEETPAKLCIHYDPALLPLSRIRTAAETAGAQIAAQYGHLLLNAEGITRPRRARTVAARLTAVEGVVVAEASAAGRVRIEYERSRTNEAALLDALHGMGVGVRRAEPPEALPTGSPEEEHAHVYGGPFGENAEMYFAVFCGVCLGAGWLLDVVTAVHPLVPTLPYAVAYFFGGYYTARESFDSVRVGRFEIDFLMLVAAIGAAILGEWAEGALLLFLFSLGHALEHYAMGRARRAIEALAEVAPKTAVVVRDGRVETVSVTEVRRGDTVVVKPDERIPADGFVLEGASSVNQAPVTGESVPVDKQPVADPEAALANPERLDAAHRVFAGSLNGAGALRVRATKPGTDTTLARVLRLVAEAETQQSPTQHFADRFERVFVPSVLALVVLLLFAGLVVEETFGASFYRAMAVLVAASPCALAIATPSAVLAAVARAGREGVLIKGGGPLESLGTLGAIAFDKTGTLTEGKPRVTDVAPAEGVAREDLLRNAVAVERLSDHPLAAAVVHAGQEELGAEGAPPAQDLESITGLGIKAVVEGKPVLIGKDTLFETTGGPPLPEAVRGTVERLEEEGRTTMIVRRDGRYLGVIGLMDTPRSSARFVVAALRDLGIRRLLMISGDNRRVAEAVARHVGLDEARGDLMPEDKVDIVKALRREQPTAMVGDGVNDAPAMAHATVGIAMGAAGSDMALETADVALMADDLTKLPFAVGLSRRSRSVIRQNLWLSLGMVAFLVPATVLGLRIGPAVALHEGSTVIVIFNALRLLAYRDPSKRTRSMFHGVPADQGNSI